jgi:hypothetical protein
MPSSAPTVGITNRRLRAPIRGLLTGDDVKAFMAAHQSRGEAGISVVSVVADSSQRMLQDGAAQSDFGLEVGLQGINGDSSGQDDSSTSSGGGSAIVVAVLSFILLAAGCGLLFFLCAKKLREEKGKIAKHRRANTYHDYGCYSRNRNVAPSGQSVD